MSKHWIAAKNRNRRHHKEISATYTAIAIVSSFVVLHLPRHEDDSINSCSAVIYARK
jgi:hypothetical protein